MNKLTSFLVAVLREILNHGPLIVTMVTLAMGHFGMFLMLLMLTFYFKLAEIADNTQAFANGANLKIEFKSEVQPVLNAVIANDAKEEHF